MSDYDGYYETPTIRGLIKQYITRDWNRLKRFFRRLSYRLKTPKQKAYFDVKYGNLMLEWTNQQSKTFNLLAKQPCAKSGVRVKPTQTQESA